MRILREYPDKTALMINLYIRPYKDTYVKELDNVEITPSDTIWLMIGLRGLEYESLDFETFKKNINESII